MQLLHVTPLFLTLIFLSTTYAAAILPPTLATDLQSTTDTTADRENWVLFQYGTADCTGPSLNATGTQTVDCANYNGTFDASAATPGNTDYKTGGWYYCLYELSDCNGICHKMTTRQCIESTAAWKIESVSITPGPP